MSLDITVEIYEVEMHDSEVDRSHIAYWHLSLSHTHIVKANWSDPCKLFTVKCCQAGLTLVFSDASPLDEIHIMMGTQKQAHTFKKKSTYTTWSLGCSGRPSVHPLKKNVPTLRATSIRHDRNIDGGEAQLEGMMVTGTCISFVCYNYYEIQSNTKCRLLTTLPTKQ